MVPVSDPEKLKLHGTGSPKCLSSYQLWKNTVIGKNKGCMAFYCVDTIFHSFLEKKQKDLTEAFKKLKHAQLRLLAEI